MGEAQLPEPSELDQRGRAPANAIMVRDEHFESRGEGPSEILRDARQRVMCDVEDLKAAEDPTVQRPMKPELMTNGNRSPKLITTVFKVNS